MDRVRGDGGRREQDELDLVRDRPGGEKRRVSSDPPSPPQLDQHDVEQLDQPDSGVTRSSRFSRCLQPRRLHDDRMALGVAAAHRSERICTHSLSLYLQYRAVDPSSIKYSLFLAPCAVLMEPKTWAEVRAWDGQGGYSTRKSASCFSEARIRCSAAVPSPSTCGIHKTCEESFFLVAISLVRIHA
mmetsp:Transcript_28448/g.64513  ORF Transcript_28448/g.64513 Transcript_28448/m.64513 type:complete len:186 (-) Transcript_28448:734-1291(-)